MPLEEILHIIDCSIRSQRQWRMTLTQGRSRMEMMIIESIWIRLLEGEQRGIVRRSQLKMRRMIMNLKVLLIKMMQCLMMRR